MDAAAAAAAAECAGAAGVASAAPATLAEHDGLAFSGLSEHAATTDSGAAGHGYAVSPATHVWIGISIDWQFPTHWWLRGRATAWASGERCISGSCEWAIEHSVADAAANATSRGPNTSSSARAIAIVSPTLVSVVNFTNVCSATTAPNA